MDARVTPHAIDRRGIGRLTPERVLKLAKGRKTVCLVSRGRITARHPLRVRAEVIDDTDPLGVREKAHPICCCSPPDLMGNYRKSWESSPGVEQTAYGLFSDGGRYRRVRSFVTAAAALLEPLRGKVTLDELLHSLAPGQTQPEPRLPVPPAGRYRKMDSTNVLHHPFSSS